LVRSRAAGRPHGAGRGRVILSFSGDPFLSRRAARCALQELGRGPGAVTELCEGLDKAQGVQRAGPGGLSGHVALHLDRGAALCGQGGVRPRDELMEALAGLPDAAIVVAIDPDATPARQKRWSALGKHVTVPTPRFEALPRWVRSELEAAGLRFEPDVPAT